MNKTNNKTNISVKDMPHFMRPREKLHEKGVLSLKDYELLAVILRSGSEQMNVFNLARTLFEHFSLDQLSQASVADLKKIKGIGLTRATSLLAAIEFGRRVMSYDMMPSINTPEDVIKAVSFIKNKKREYFMGLYLNARRQLIMTHIISIGTLDMSIAHPREVFEPAIKHNAASVIIVHNHPSGDPEPSNADIVLTRRLVEAGSMLDIQIQDHIILTDKKYISFSKEDYL
jgi:DNA repair protein RadC